MVTIVNAESCRPPQVSIGMPVYNGGATIREALDSLLAQTFSDFELIISDNASTDNTEAICREYSAKDVRIRYVRQPTNIGLAPNFKFVLDQARSDFFLWAAADDLRSLDFVALNYQFLKNHPDYVCSVSPVRFEGRDFDEVQMGDRSLDDERFDLRIRRFFGAWHANGAFYSLMRTSVIKECEWEGEDFLGADWAIVLYLARQGKLNRLEQGWLELGINGASSSGDIFRRYQSTLLDSLVPFWRMSQEALDLSIDAPFTSRIIIFWECLVMNVWALKLQMIGWLYGLYKLIKAKIRRLISGGTAL
jgi:glycosyltransferase involved in cell wall biosynthesis